MPKKFEWYYVDLHSDEGYDLVFKWHTAPFMSVFRNGILDCFLYLNGKKICHYAIVYPQERLVFRKEPLKLGYDNFAEFNKMNSRYFLEIEHTHFKMELEFENLLPDKLYEVENLNPDPNDQDSFIWKLISPLSSGKARIAWMDNEWEVSGRVYFDYNAGDMFFKEKLKSWIWQKVYLGNQLFIGGQINSKNNWIRDLLIHIDSNGIKKINNGRLRMIDRNIYISGDEITSTLNLDEIKQIDNIRFFTGKEGNLLNKVREAGSYFSGKLPTYLPLNLLLSNVHYKRYKGNGKDSSGGKIFSFREEINF